MGRVVEIETSAIIPSQGCLNEKSLKSIFSMLKNKKRIAPFPVREHPKKKGIFIALDGHNRCAIDDLFMGESCVFIASNSKDIITYDELPEEYSFIDWKLLRDMNENIRWRFNEALRAYESEKIPCSFKKLRGKYSFLGSIKKAEEYFDKRSMFF